MSYRVIITGSRNATDRQAVFDSSELACLSLWEGSEKADPTAFTIVHGACSTGVDRIADFWATTMGMQVERHPAQWDTHDENCYHRPSPRCPAAGPRRNKQMIESGADLVLAFPLGKFAGTRGCIKLAEDAGLKVIVHDFA